MHYLYIKLLNHESLWMMQVKTPLPRWQRSTLSWRTREKASVLFVRH